MTATPRSIPTIPTCDEDPAPVLQATGINVRVRFAPSPTGSLHVGGARTALFNYLKARNEGGKFILRIEDTDEARSTRESEESMLADLRWLELDWDEGPDRRAPGDVGPYRQSERKDIYLAYAKKLVESGHAYPCFSTEEELDAKRKQAEAEGGSPQYDGTWRDADPAEVKRRMDAGEPYTYRFKVPKGKKVVINDLVRGTVSWDAESTVGDFILLRSNGVPVYNFCVAVDDATMSITHVIRAEEHLTNTLRQALILDALDFARPQYSHCSLILAEDRSKLSKRHGATSVDEFKRQGFTKEGMLNYLALLGWNDGSNKEVFTRNELISGFALERVIKSAAVFDNNKLRWVNGQHLRSKPIEELIPLVAEVLVKNQLATETSGPYMTLAASICQEHLELVNDAVPVIKKCLFYPLSQTLQTEEAAEIMNEGFVEVATALLQKYKAGEMPAPSSENFNDEWKSFMKAFGKELKRKGKALYHPTRMAITGSVSGPDMGAQLVLLHLAKADKVLHTSLAERMDILEKQLKDL